MRLGNLVTVEVEEQRAWVTMNRPEKLNALSKELVEELIQELDKLDQDSCVNVILLKGGGKGFCGGGDIASMKAVTSNSEAVHWIESVAALTKKVLDMNTYVVACVHGYAAGAGFSLALACDFIVATDDAKFALSFANIGLIPDLGLIKLLSSRVSPAIVKEWISSAKVLTSEEAKQHQLINHVAVNDLTEEVLTFIPFIEEGPSAANTFVKYLVNHHDEVPLENFFKTETMMQTALLSSHDHKEGVEAFFEKRKPVFQGN